MESRPRCSVGARNGSDGIYHGGEVVEFGFYGTRNRNHLQSVVHRYARVVGNNASVGIVDRHENVFHDGGNCGQIDVAVHKRGIEISNAARVTERAAVQPLRGAVYFIEIIIFGIRGILQT